MPDAKSHAQTITVSPGVDLAVETLGDRSHAALLMIQGAGNSMVSWDRAFCQRLADGGLFVIRYDTRDVGRSTIFEIGNPGYGLRDLAADALALLDHFQVKRAHVFGLSLGAGIAQLLAIDHPDRVASLILMSGTPGGPGHETTGLPPMDEAIARLFRGEAAWPEPDWGDREAVARYLVEGERPFAGGGMFDEHWMLETARRIHDHALNLAAQLTNPFLVEAGEPWRHRLGSIGAPTLVLHGDRDPLFPLGHGQALAREIPGARLMVLPNVGHAHLFPALRDLVSSAILQHTGA
jgi:pimeloyl-ACP methyl ester carboxylesterase